MTENPENSIEYDILKNNDKPLMIKAIGKDERAKKTVNNLTGINDREVLTERGDQFEIYKAINLLPNNLEKKQEIKNKLCSSSCKFAGLARFYFKSLDLFDGETR